jgi:malate dehydrogenase (oxaloacetate-decarboxylating)
MKPLAEPFASIVAGRPTEIDLRGYKLLGARLFAKDLAFRQDEREAFGLTGMLPDRVQTIEEQVQLEWEHVQRFRGEIKHG